MTVSPEVSVCIRAYARPNDLRAAIASVLDQTFGDFEVIVSDASGRLGVVAERFGDPRVRYSASPAVAGPAANLRRAIGLASGRLLAILNEDDRWRPEFLTTVVDRFAAHPDAGVVFTGASFELGGRQRDFQLPYRAGQHDRFATACVNSGIPASSAVLRRTTWEDGEREAPLADGMVADLFLWLRAARSGWPFVFVDQPLAVLGFHPDQISWGHGLPARMIATLTALELDEPSAERARRAALANAYLATTRADLRRRRPRHAAQDLRHALAWAPGRPGRRELFALTGLREAIMRWGSAHPDLLLRLLDAWGRRHPQSWYAPPRDGAPPSSHR